MKKLLLLLAMASAFLINAQNYQFLGNYTSNGTPLYLINPRDTVSVATQEMISNSLPESYPVPDFNPHYISSGYDTDIILEKDAEVWVTFVSEGAGYRNVLGFYTYDVNNPLLSAPAEEDITIIFPNASALGSGGGLQIGDKVKIGDFEAGTGIGWVLLANAWSSNTSTVGYGKWQLYSNPDFNPESQEHLRHHNVLLLDPDNERIILGFEDIRRDYGSCDNDFNDAIFYVTASPYNAIKTTNYADVDSATDVTSGNDGGLESNGDLANLIAKRNFKRKQNGVNKSLKTNQIAYQPQLTFASQNTNSVQSVKDYLPSTGMFGTETAFVSSPEDLLDVTNANEIFSIDFYQGNSRVSAVLATATQESVYDHSKMICDRLNNSSLEDVRTVIVREHQIISSKIRRATGEIEYTLSFSVKLGTTTNQLFSFWNIEQYPEGDYYNFQIWGGSFSQVFSISNHIIDTLNSQKPLTSTILDDVTPTVFVKSGYYSNGNITLNIINKVNANHISFTGSIAATEVSDRHTISQEVSLNGNWNQAVTIPVGTLFDIGFSISTAQSNQQDALYLADGPWALDYLEDYATISSFDIDTQATDYYDDIYEIERQPRVSGQVKGNVNLFRHILPGDQTLKITDYDALQFDIVNDHPIEIVLMPENLDDWNNRLRYTLPVNLSETYHSISLHDFVDANGNPGSIQDVKTIVFSVIGDYAIYVPFNLEINNLAFGLQSTLSTPDVVLENTKLKNYPNPFTVSTTIEMPTPFVQYADITVVDMLGRVVDVQHISTITNRKNMTYTAPKLTKGIYKYVLNDDLNNRYTGTFVIK